MGIKIADILEAGTVEGIVANATDIKYTSGDTSTNSNSVADQLTKLMNGKVYCTQDQYDTWASTPGQLKDDVEYNIYEED